MKGYVKLLFLLVLLGEKTVFSMNPRVAQVSKHVFSEVVSNYCPQIMTSIHVDIAPSAAQEMIGLIDQSEKIFAKHGKNRVHHISPTTSFLQLSALLEYGLAPNKMLPHGWSQSVGRALFYLALDENNMPDGLQSEYEDDEVKSHYLGCAWQWLGNRFPLGAIESADQEHINICNSMVEPHETIHMSPHNLEYWKGYISNGETHINGEQIITTPAAGYFIARQLNGEMPSENLWQNRIRALSEQKNTEEKSFKHRWSVLPPYRFNTRYLPYGWGEQLEGVCTFNGADGQEHTIPWRGK